jgi:hypothetical protein
MFRLIALAVCFAMPAVAQQQCGPRVAVLSHLASKYGEARQSIAVAANGVVVETWANLDAGTWTITGTRADGVTCLIASGDAYEATHDAVPPQGVPG